MQRISRAVDRVIDPQPLLEGAGVRVKRSIANRVLNYLDPFLLLDHFGSTDPDEYCAGFPLHPHRGIETVTYMLEGAVHHQDTLGNSGSIGAGDLQWMTAGRGIMHEEMPIVRPEGVSGFQLWVNLPAKSKMMRPRYQDISARQLPLFTDPEGVQVRVVAGEVAGVRGPITQIEAEPLYIDAAVPPNALFTQAVPRGHNAFAYIWEGQGFFGVSDKNEGAKLSASRLVVFGDGDEVKVRTGDQPVRFLLVAGKPLNEPVARYGPFVMNTKEEIEQALEDLRRGTFVEN